MRLVRSLLLKTAGSLVFAVMLNGCNLSVEIQKSSSESALVIENKTPAVIANASNISSVPISGKCSSESGDVTVNVGALFSKTISCVENQWTDNLDLTPLVDNDAYEITASQSNSTGASTTDTAVLIVDTVIPQVTGLTDSLLPAASVTSGWSCLDAADLCKFRSLATNNPVFTFTVELYDTTNNLIQLNQGQSYVYVQAIDKAQNVSAPVRVDTYVGLPKLFIGGLQKSKTETGIEDLNILAATSLSEMALFNNEFCTGAPSWIPRANIVSAWNLDPASAGGTAAVSVKFKTADGQISSCYSDTILWPSPTMYTMCSSTTSSLDTGIIQDSGGAASDYSNDESCTFSLTLPGSTTFSFENVVTEDGWDFIKVIEGGTEILNYSGADPIPDITTTNTSVQIQFESDSSVTESGFKISWQPSGGSTAADPFSLSINNNDSVTGSANITADLTYDSIFREVYLTEDNTCSSGGTWGAVAAQRPWTFSTTTNGTKDLFVKFRDVFGNESFCEGDSISLITPTITIDSPPGGVNIQTNLELDGTCSLPGSTVEFTGSVSGTDTCDNDGTWYKAFDISGLANSAAVTVTANLKNGTTTLASTTENYTIYRTLSITSPAASSYIGTAFTLSGTCNSNGTTIESSSPSVASTTCSGGTWSLNLTASGNDGDPVNASVSMKIGATVQETKTRSFVLSTAAPVAVIYGAPTGTSIEASITVGVGGTSVDKYKYKFGSGVTCSDPTGYSAEIAVATSTNLNQSALANGPVTLCVIGRSALNGSWQTAAAATVANWTKDSEVSVTITTANQIVTEGATGLQLTATLGGTKNIDTRVYYSIYGSIYMADHNLAEGYITIPAGNLSASISYDTFGNGLADGDREVRIYLTHTNSAAVTLGKENITTVLIKDDDQVYKSILKIAMGPDNTCAIYSDDRLRCWGSNEWGQLGVGNKQDTPETIEPYAAERFMDVSITRGWACAITTGKKLFCWGRNFGGQLGTGDTTERLTPTAVDAAENYVKVETLHSGTTCALTDVGKVKCWGENSSGQLGIGNTTPQLSPVAVDSGETYASLTETNFGVCGITTLGALKCWGYNGARQIEPSTTANQTSPVVVDSGTSYSSISGNNAYCGITTTGVLKCWGYNVNGEVSGAVGSPVTSPTVIDAGTTYKQVSVTDSFVCGITSNDDLKCWGTLPGIVNASPTYSASSPTIVPGGFKYSSIVAASSYGACGLTLDGVLICMGDFENQVFESRHTIGMYDIDPLSTIVTYSVGDYTSCVINSAGTASCFGGYYSGTQTYLTTRVIAELGASYSGGNVSSTASGVCLMNSAGAMKCTGVNYSGSVGDGSTTQRRVFTSVAPTIAFANNARDTACAAGVSKTGKLYGWSGCGSGSSTPVALDAAETYQTLLGVVDHACALTTANDLKCWGADGSGVLGGSDRTTPTLLDSGTKYKSFVVANSFTCGITTADKLKCWGKGTTGRLANGGTGNSSTPVPIDAANNYTKVSAGYNAVCGVTSTGDLKCWGYVGNYISNATYTTPQLVNAGTSYQDVAVSTDSIMAITAAGEIHYWPRGRFDQALQVMAAGKTFKSIKSYWSGTTFCAMTTDDHVYCSAKTNSWKADRVTTPKAMPFSRWLL